VATCTKPEKKAPNRGEGKASSAGAVKVSIRDVEAARNELKIMLDRATRAARKPAELNALQYTALIYLTGARDERVASLFPDSTRDQRYQWKKRVVDALWDRASPMLKTFLKHAGPCIMVRRPD
jgi:hypothetical protein